MCKIDIQLIQSKPRSGKGGNPIDALLAQNKTRCIFLHRGMSIFGTLKGIGAISAPVSVKFTLSQSNSRRRAT